MKQLNRGQGLSLGLALIAAGLAVQPVVGAQAAPTNKAQQSDVSRLRDAASGSVDLRANPATGRVGFARAEGNDPDLFPGVAAEGRQGAIEKATAYLAEFAPAFGARAAELEQTEVYAGPAGWSVTFAQSYQGVPVFAGELKAHVDRDGDLTAVNGFVAPDIDLDVTPTLSRDEASARALQAVKAKPAGHEDGLPAAFAKGLQVRNAELVVYRTGTPRGVDGTATLAWAVEVWNKTTIRESLILDAATGKPLNRWSMMAHATDRELYEESYTPADKVYTEGDTFPGTLDQDQQNEILGAGESYWLFENTFGFDSWDGAGGKMITVNNDPTISCPNANWNGVTTNYCTGVTGDDTVAHEWGHAYTEATSGLIYQWQSGAMNEAYSDIWGETVDMLNNRMNETGETNSPGGAVLRTPGECSQYTRSLTDDGRSPPRPRSPGACVASRPPSARSSPRRRSTRPPSSASTPPTRPARPTTDGCSPFTNGAAIAGNWVYVDRGTCNFAVKIDNAEAAGAEGIVVGNSTAGAPGSMRG